MLDAVIWRPLAQRLALKPEDGMEVVCTGRMTTYAGRSKYQLVIEAVELAGDRRAAEAARRAAQASSPPKGCSTRAASGRCPICPR